MRWVFMFAVIGGVLGLLSVLKEQRRRKGIKIDDTEIWPFYVKRVLSDPEQVLYFRLVKALPEFIVLAQVQVSRFLGIKKGYDFQAWLNRINRLSCDFLVCSKDFNIIAAIELDDSSHERGDRETTDVKKDKALGVAGVRMVRWNVGRLPDEASIRRDISGEARV